MSLSANTHLASVPHAPISPGQCPSLSPCPGQCPLCAEHRQQKPHSQPAVQAEGTPPCVAVSLPPCQPRLSQVLPLRAGPPFPLPALQNAESLHRCWDHLSSRRALESVQGRRGGTSRTPSQQRQTLCRTGLQGRRTLLLQPRPPPHQGVSLPCPGRQIDQLPLPFTSCI